MTPEQHDELAHYLAAHPLLAPYVAAAIRGEDIWMYGPTAPLPTPEELAGSLLEDAEFRALRLGTWLSTPVATSSSTSSVV
jgi:hypothetical protein